MSSAHRQKQAWVGAFVVASTMLGVATYAIAADAKYRRLSAVGIRTTIIGKVVTDDAHWADRFMPDGTVDSHELGNSRPGSWAIERGELCITRKAKHPVKECFEIWVKSDEVEYRRDGVSVISGKIRDPAP